MDMWLHKNPKYEREFQQLLVRENNNQGDISKSTDYYILDIEYTDDNKFSFEGGFNTHITYGISIITSIAQTLNLNVTDPIFIQLIGIVASHHNQLEYGSPSRPATPEAMLVAFADNIDAGMKGALESISNLPEGSRTEPIKSLNGARFTVIDNKSLFGNNH